MKNILLKIDKVLCGYLGLDKSETTSHYIEKKGPKLVILNTESYKRHAQKMPLAKINLSTMNKENKEKLGAAVGKAIAKNLVISFEEVTIKRENTHAG